MTLFSNLIYLKLNFELFSNAICGYFVDKYAKDDSFYQKGLQLRAKCNQRMYFDAVTLSIHISDCTIHAFTGGKEMLKKSTDSIYKAYGISESFLASDPFLVCDRLTIADFTTSTVILLEPIASKR